MSGHRILVTSRSFGTGNRDASAELEASGLAVVRGQADHDLDTLRDTLGDAVAWIAGAGAITAAHLAASPQLRVIARYGVGVDAVDRSAAARFGITLTNTPGANTSAVADHTLGLMLASLRGIVPGDRNVRAGDWKAIRGRELGSATVGIIGFGRIGRAVATRTAGFGARVLAYDPYVGAAAMAQEAAVPAPLADLARRCDIVSLHAPGGQRVITAAWLAEPGPPLLLVNTARAGLIDEPAVAAAMRSGRVAWFAADMLAAENAAGACSSALLAPELADRVIVTPHVAAQTIEAIDRMTATTVDDVLAVLAGRPPRHAVPPPRETQCSQRT